MVRSNRFAPGRYKLWGQTKQVCPHGRNALVEVDPGTPPGPEDSETPGYSGAHSASAQASQRRSAVGDRASVLYT